LRPGHPSPKLNLPRRDTPYIGAMISPSQGGPVRHAFEQVDQLLQDAEATDVIAPSSDESRDRHAGNTNLTLVVRYRGLERAIPLCLSDAIGKLVIEAQFREMSVGQLIGTLIRDTLAKGLY
jgi:hypothetical protein